VATRAQSCYPYDHIKLAEAPASSLREDSLHDQIYDMLDIMLLARQDKLVEEDNPLVKCNWKSTVLWHMFLKVISLYAPV